MRCLIELVFVTSQFHEMIVELIMIGCLFGAITVACDVLGAIMQQNRHFIYNWKNHEDM